MEGFVNKFIIGVLLIFSSSYCIASVGHIERRFSIICERIASQSSQVSYQNSPLAKDNNKKLYKDLEHATVDEVHKLDDKIKFFNYRHNTEVIYRRDKYPTEEMLQHKLKMYEDKLISKMKF